MKFKSSNKDQTWFCKVQGRLSYISLDDEALWNIAIKQRLTELLLPTCTMTNHKIFILECTVVWGQQKPSYAKIYKIRAKCFFLSEAVNASLHDIENCAIFIREYHY
jgi:hypothetical protein